MEQELFTIYIFSGVWVAQCLGLCLMVCRSFVDHCLSLCPVFFGGAGSLYCLSSFDLGLLMTPFVSSNVSWPPCISGAVFAQSLIVCVVFCRLLFSLCPVSFGHCIVSVVFASRFLITPFPYVLLGFVFFWVFCRSLLFCFPFSFAHCIVCHS